MMADENATRTRFTEIIAIALLVVALLSIQLLIGGTRLIFAIPAYGAIALVGLLAAFSSRQRKPAPHQIALASSLLFFAYIEARALTSSTPHLAQSDIHAVLAGLIVYFFTSCVFTSPAARMRFVGALLAASLAHVLVAAIQFRNGDNFMPIHALQRFDYGSRGSGFYICPNHLAGLLEVLGVFGVSMVCWSRWPIWAKLLVAYATVVCYTGVILTGSRGGYLSVAASLIVFALLSCMILKSARSAVLWKIGGAAALLGAAFLAVSVFLIGHSKDLTERATNVVDTQNMRLDLWQAALEQWRLHPIVGTGAGTYVIFGRMFRTERMQLDPRFAHNDYLQLLAEYGGIGVALFLVFLAVHMRSGFLDFRRLGARRIAVSGQIPSNALALNIGALCAVAAYGVHSVFDFNLHIPANLLLMAFVFALLTNAGVRREAARRSGTGWRMVAPLLAIVLAAECLRLGPGAYFAERARVALRDYRPLEAVAYGLRGLEAERRDPELFFTLGRARIQLADTMTDPRARDSFLRAALDEFLAARTLAPLDKTFAIESALTFDALHRFDEAEWMFYEARTLDPKSTATSGYYRSHLAQWGAKSLPDGALE